jgi:CIC family chloride channel protein
MLGVSKLMRPVDSLDAGQYANCEALMTEGHSVRHDATLETALPMFATLDLAYLPVRGEERQLLGVLHHVDALLAYNRALTETATEEHS